MDLASLRSGVCRLQPAASLEPLRRLTLVLAALLFQLAHDSSFEVDNLFLRVGLGSQAQGVLLHEPVLLVVLLSSSVEVCVEDDSQRSSS